MCSRLSSIALTMVCVFVHSCLHEQQLMACVFVLTVAYINSKWLYWGSAVDWKRLGTDAQLPQFWEWAINAATQHLPVWVSYPWPKLRRTIVLETAPSQSPSSPAVWVLVFIHQELVYSVMLSRDIGGPFVWQASVPCLDSLSIGWVYAWQRWFLVSCRVWHTLLNQQHPDMGWCYVHSI